MHSTAPLAEKVPNGLLPLHQMDDKEAQKRDRHRRSESTGSGSTRSAEKDDADVKPGEGEESAPWRSLFAFTTRSNIPLLIAGIICSIAAGATIPAHNLITGELFDQFTRYATGEIDADEFMRRETKWVAYVAAIAGATWVLHSFEFGIWLSFGELQAKNARDRLFQGLLEKEIEWYDMRKNGIGAQLPRWQAQIRELQLATAVPLGSLFALSATAILSLVQAFLKSWKLTLVTLAGAPIFLALAAWAGSPMEKNIKLQQDRLTEASKHTTNAFASIETVKCFNGQQVEAEKYRLAVQQAARFWAWVAHGSAFQMALIVLLSVSMFVQGFYYGGVLIANGEIDSGDVITTFFSAIGAFQAIQGILPQMIVLEKGKVAGSTMRKIMAQVDSGSTISKSKAALAPAACKGNIEIKGLTFAYPVRPELPAVRDITMYLQGGGISFIIGKSGSGKSTISQLLMRFYSSPPGTISLDGNPLELLDTTWLRTNITLVEQTSLLFHDTVFQNIAFGRKDYKNVTKEDVMQAIQFALLQLTVSDMPNGLDTMVGFKGSDMSGGQRQRMALARARIRDTPILILDESTSALDYISRTLIMEALRQWRQGKTTIIITHDISQILADDYVYLLEQGVLVQEGYRKQLEKSKGTPFQAFLSEEQKAALSPLRTSDPFDLDSLSSTQRSSMDLDYAFEKYKQTYFDPLDAELTATENKRQSKMKLAPNVFNEGSPMPLMRTYTPKAPTSAFASPWMRITGTPLGPSSPGTSDPKSSPDATVQKDGLDSLGNRRWSQVFEKLIDQTGKFAAETRRPRSGFVRQRRPIREDDGIPLTGREEALTKLESKEDAEARSKDNKKLKTIFKTIWPNLDWTQRALLILGFWGATVHAVATPVFSFILSKLLQTYAVPGGDKKKALEYAMAILAVAFTDSIHTYAFRFLLENVGQAWVDNIRNTAYSRILDQSRDFFEKEENGVSRLTENLDRNAEEMRNLLGRFAALAYTAALMTIVALLWCMASQWKMTLIALAVVPYIWGVTNAYARVAEHWEGRANDASEGASAIFTETFTNIKTVRALTLEPHFLEKYLKATASTLNVGFKRSFYTGFFFGLSDSAGGFSTALIFYVGARFATQGISIGDIILVFTMLIFAITNVGAILEFIPQIGSSKDTASRLFRLAQLDRSSHEHLGDTRITTVGDIIFDDLDFSYPSRPTQRTLKNINLRFKPGTTTALVGGSGSGKSTIANLMLDLYSTATVPNAKLGDLTFGGRDVKHIYTPSLRAMIVPVSQTPTLFASTVSENIAYGLPIGHPCNTPASIASAARQAGVHDFILSLPQGYDTLIGDGGLSLSGGQSQRIAIARALVRKPSVLILDEATSALDVESSNLIRHTIKSLVDNHDDDRSHDSMTVVIITHHKDMMEIAERVVVLDQGEIVEEGAFDELMAKKRGALANLLGGGEWTAERRVSKRLSLARRSAVPPMLKSVDWKKDGGDDGGRKRRRGGMGKC